MKKKANFWFIVAGIGFGVLAIYLLLKPQFPNPSVDLAASIGGWLSLVLSALSIIKLVKDLVKPTPPASVTPIVTYHPPTVASNNINAPITARNLVVQVNQGSNDTTVTDIAGRGGKPSKKKVVRKKLPTNKVKKPMTAKKSKKTGTARKAVA